MICNKSVKASCLKKSETLTKPRKSGLEDAWSGIICAAKDDIDSRLHLILAEA